VLTKLKNEGRTGGAGQRGRGGAGLCSGWGNGGRLVGFAGAFGVGGGCGGVAGRFKRRGAGDLGVRAPDGKSGEICGRRPVRERRLREEGEGADRRARGLSESDARAGRAD